MKHNKRILSALIALLMLVTLLGSAACTKTAPHTEPESEIVELPLYSPEASKAPTSEPTHAPTATPKPTAEPTAFATSEPSAAPTAELTSVPTSEPTHAPTPTPKPTATPCPVSEDGEYWTKDEVALYIHLFGHLPKNYITKNDAQALGWTGGSLEPYAPGCSIGGGYFGNYEGILPSKKGRKYTECDIDTRGAKSRGAKRIVFSNDGLIYYTDDHYESFTLLYGEE